MQAFTAIIKHVVFVFPLILLLSACNEILEEIDKELEKAQLEQQAETDQSAKQAPAQKASDKATSSKSNPLTFKPIKDCKTVNTLQSVNLYLLFDHRKDGARYEKFFSKSEYYEKLDRIVNYFDDQLCLPDIVAFQEVESARVLEDVAKRINKYLGSNYQPILIEGNDLQGIDVGFIYQAPFRLKNKTVIDPKKKSEFGGYVHDRPPLVATFVNQDSDKEVTVINVHLRSMRGIEGEDSERIIGKRIEQAKSITRSLKYMDDNRPLILIGDMNSKAFTDDELSDPIRYFKEKTELQLLSDLLPKSERYSYRHDGKRVLIDHALANGAAFDIIKSYGFIRGVGCASSSSSCHPIRKVSDHEPMFVQFKLQ